MGVKDSVKKLFQPIREGTVTTRVLKVLKLAPDPNPLDFTNPLKTDMQAVLDRKNAVCTNHCTGCKYATGTGCTFDAEFQKVIDESGDAEPYVTELIGELKQTRTENQNLQAELQLARNDVNPNRRALYVIGGTTGALLAKAVWDVFFQSRVIDLINNILPMILFLLTLR